jgi:ubiquinone/menaquinone biosynthesis C-methylase UbiE
LELSDATVRQVFFEVHRGLPRQGPGNRENTARAVAALGEMPASPRILDIACGPGKQTIDLAELIPEASITAVEFHAPFVEEARRRAKAAGCAERVTVLEGDMRALPFEPGSFDLIWCEGAAYIMGVSNALAAWRPLLATGGRLAFTEAVWFQDHAPQKLRDFWRDGYPDMGDGQTTLSRVTDAGYRILDHFPLPDSAWWEDYYAPMESNIVLLRERLRERYQSDADQQQVLATLDGCQLEIDLFRHHSEKYGYLFVVAAT